MVDRPPTNIFRLGALSQENDMKTPLVFVAALIFWTLPLSAEKISLEGSDVIYYKYPDNFQESNRYIRK